MSKAIRSYPKHEQEQVVARRLANKTMGLGYWAAVGYADWKKKESAHKAKENKNV